MDIHLVILAIWLLESSRGSNMNHPSGHAHGHLGIEDITIRDLNERAGYEKWTVADTMDKAKSFAMAEEHIRNYKMQDKTAYEIFLFWRLGYSGMKRPFPKALEYAAKGVDEYVRLKLAKEESERKGVNNA